MIFNISKHNYWQLIKVSVVNFVFFYLLFWFYLPTLGFTFFPISIIWVIIFVVTLVYLFLSGRDKVSLMNYYLSRSISIIPLMVMFTHSGSIIADSFNDHLISLMYWCCLAVVPVIVVPLSLKSLRRKYHRPITKEMMDYILKKELDEIDNLPWSNEEIVERNPKAAKWLRLIPFATPLSLYLARRNTSILSIGILIGFSLIAQIAIAGVIAWIPNAIIFSNYFYFDSKKE